MRVHPLTLEYLRLVALRPGMYMQDFDLLELELQLYGFEAGLDAAGAFSDFDRFNRSFSEYLVENDKLSCSRGWAYAIRSRYGQGEVGFQKFLSLLAKATQ